MNTKKGGNVRKITLAISLCLGTSISAFATTQATDINTLESQIKALQQKVIDIQQKQTKELKTQSNTNTNHQLDLGQYLFWDASKTKPFGENSSSKIPISLLKVRNLFPDQSIAFGGVLETDATAWWGDSLNTTKNSNYQSGKGIYINEASLYVISNLSHLVQADMTFTGASYENPSIRDAFVTFGNLDSSPVYLTVGKNRLSFGSFANGGPWIGGITQVLFRPGHNTVSANLGFYKDGINLNAAYFQSNTQSSDFMLSGFYDGESGKFSYGANAGYMYNWIGTGMGAVSNVQNNPTSSNHVNDNQNGVVNLEGYTGYDIYLLNVGWAGTTKKETYSNNNRLGAWYVQGTVSPEIYHKNTQFSLGYQQAYNTQNIPFSMPGNEANEPEVNGIQSEITAFVTRPMFAKNNFVSLEYGYLRTYTHQHSNEITLDIYTYF